MGRWVRIGRLIPALSLLFAVIIFAQSIASAANPTSMSFQGKVVNANGTNVTDGTYSFVFRLYSIDSGGTAIWTETQSTVAVTSGVFQVKLGSVCPLFSANACNNNLPVDFNAVSNMYLGITFNGDAAGEMTPRVQLQSVPFAFNSDRVGGFTASQLVQLSPASQQAGFINVSGASTFAGGITVNGGAVLINSTGAANTTLGGSTGLLQIGGTGAGAVTLQSASTLTIDTLNFDVTSGGAISAATTNTINGISINAGAVSGVTTLAAASGKFNVDAQGGLTSVFTVLNGTSTASGGSGLGGSTSLTLTSAANFDVGNYVQMNSANCGGTGINPCYAKITAKATNTLTITPALTWATGSTVNEYFIPEIGGSDTSQPLVNRFGRGYFIAGVATGNGTTFYGEDSITSTLTTFNLLNDTVTTLNIGAAASNISIGSASSAVNILGGISVAGNMGLNSGTGLLQGTGGMTVTGATNINTSGTAVTNIGGSTGALKIGGAGAGTLAIQSPTTIDINTSNFKVSTLGAIVAATTTNTINGLIVNAGALSGVTSITLNGAISGGTTITGTTLNATTGINTGAGAGTSRIDASGNLANIGNVTTTGTSTITTGGSGKVVIKPTTDGAGASIFEVQKATGVPLFIIENTSTNLLSNPGFEIGFTGWTARGSATISQNTNRSNTYHGVSSLQVVTTGATQNKGASTNSFTGTLGAQTYTLSFYLKLGTGALTIPRAGYAQGGADVPCTLTTTIANVSLGGFARYSCTFTSTAPLTSIWIDQGTTTTAMTYYIDAVQLQIGTAATPYEIGNMQLRGVIVNPLTVQNAADSTTAFQIQNAGGTTNTFTVDTLGNRVIAASAFAVGTTTITNGATVAVCTAAQYLGGAKLTGGILTQGTCRDDATGFSDQRLKTNIVATNSVLDSIKNINTYSFNYRCSEEQYLELNLSCKSQTGVIAQELLGIFPELVSQTEEGYYQVDYRGLSVVTMKAVTELAQKIDSKGNANLNVVTANGLRINGDFTIGGSVVYSSIKAEKGIFTQSIVSPKLAAEGALSIVSGGAGNVSIDTDSADASVVIAGEKAGALVLSRAGAQTNVLGGLSVNEKAAFNANVAVTADATKQTSGVTITQITGGNDGGLAGALVIDNATNNSKIGSAINITNSGGAGFENVLTTQNFTVSGDGAVNAKGPVRSQSGFEIASVNGVVFSVDTSGNASFAGQTTLASAVVSGGLTVNGDVTVGGLSTFQKLATFMGKALFKQDVEFEGHVIVAKDSAGYAILKTGESTVRVKFEKQYETIPVVTANVVDGQYVAVTLANITEEGFDIKLQVPAAADTKLNWTANGVRDPKTADNEPTASVEP